MGDYLRTGEPSWYITNTKVNSAFNAFRIVKSSFGLLAGVELGHVFLCQVAGNCDPIWQVTLRSSEMGFL